MTAYYLLQHLLLALGLALFAMTLPRFFHLGALPRALLGASLTPQVIGVLVMLLALAGVGSPALYAHAPGVLAVSLLAIAARNLKGHGQRCMYRIRITPANVAVTLLGAVLAAQLGLLLRDNALTLNILPHDFNVYMSAAKVFAAAPGTTSMPGFSGGLGDVIVVHPHSFIFEAYLAHALMLGGADTSFPPLDFLPRLAQQVTVVYLLLAIAGVTATLGKRWAMVASIALALCVPWVYYITESLSRDAFRIAPLLGFVVTLGSLNLNFSSALLRRGLLVGAYGALVVMSHTLGLMLCFVVGTCVLAFVVVRRRPTCKALTTYLVPLGLVAGLSVVRYVQNYLNTGELMGYGLQYTIYKGTWLEAIIGKSWTEQGQDWLSILEILLRRYSWHLQLTTLGVGILTVLFVRERGRITYLTLLLGLWAPLLIAISGALDYAGINLRNALVTNGRYALSFFLLSAPLLIVGAAHLGTKLADFLKMSQGYRQLAVVAITGFAVLLASQSLRLAPWRTTPSTLEDINHVNILHQATTCLKPGQHWFVDTDRWNVYFIKRPPVFVFTAPARPLLMTSDQATTASVLQSMALKFAVFIESSAHWQQSPLYDYLKTNWTLIPMRGGYRDHELWVSPEVRECIEAQMASSAVPPHPPGN